MCMRSSTVSVNGSLAVHMQKMRAREQNRNTTFSTALLIETSNIQKVLFRLVDEAKGEHGSC